MELFRVVLLPTLVALAAAAAAAAAAACICGLKLKVAELKLELLAELPNTLINGCLFSLLPKSEVELELAGNPKPPKALVNGAASGVETKLGLI